MEERQRSWAEKQQREFWIMVLVVALMLLWAYFGYLLARAEARHDTVGYGFGLFFIFSPAWLVGYVKCKALTDEWKWRRQWERMHGKPWSESDAAKQAAKQKGANWDP